jgi:hypothetical protein
MEARRIARRSRKFGYHQPLGSCVLYVFCPECRERVETERGYVLGAMESVTAAIDRAMVEHARFDCVSLGTREPLT